MRWDELDGHELRFITGTRTKKGFGWKLNGDRREPGVLLRRGDELGGVRKIGGYCLDAGCCAFGVAVHRRRQFRTQKRNKVD